MIVDTTEFYDTAWQWPIYCNHEQLLITLREAVSRSARLDRGVLASFTQPIKCCDALHIFTSSTGPGERFFWEQPSQQSALVGIGTATTIETHSITRFTTAAAAWRVLLDEAVIRYSPYCRGGRDMSLCPSVPPPNHSSGPLLFCGFAFDPLCFHTQLWEGFPDGLLVLPHLMLSCHAGRATLTINKIVQAFDDIEHDAEEIAVSVMRLRAATEANPEGGGTDGGRGVSLPPPSSLPSLQPAERSGSVLQVPLSAQDLLSADEWMEQVVETVKMIQHGAYEKVVLARGVRVTPASPMGAFDVGATLNRLRLSYPGASIFAIQRGERYFVGATPERLIRAQNGQIQTMALAGSAPRGTTEEEDRRIGAELLQSKKNKAEHAIVVAMMREALANLCTRLWVADTPQLLRLKNIQHLETPIVGELIPGRCILEAIEGLHPTPAVGGFPRQAALEAIRAGERLDRGWYAGPIGWVGANGNGEFAVALRSALIDGAEATLFAGCGIVADSDPQSEYDESCLKLQVMLRGLGGED
jgi:isochorismate synthase